jgi:hypothetical protein
MRYFVKKNNRGMYEVIGMFGVCGTYESKGDAAQYRNQLNKQRGG